MGKNNAFRMSCLLFRLNKEEDRKFLINLLKNSNLINEQQYTEYLESPNFLGFFHEIQERLVDYGSLYSSLHLVEEGDIYRIYYNKREVDKCGEPLLNESIFIITLKQDVFEPFSLKQIINILFLNYFKIKDEDVKNEVLKHLYYVNFIEAY